MSLSRRGATDPDTVETTATKVATDSELRILRPQFLNRNSQGYPIKLVAEEGRRRSKHWNPKHDGKRTRDLARPFWHAGDQAVGMASSGYRQT
jgi:hypothetical protein